MKDGNIVTGVKVAYGESSKVLVVESISGNAVTLKGIPIPVSLEKLTVIETGFEGKIEPGCSVLALKDALVDPTRCNGNFKWKGRVDKEATEPFIFYNNYYLPWFYVFLDAWTVEKVYPDTFVSVRAKLRFDNQEREYVAAIGPVEKLVKVPKREP